MILALLFLPVSCLKLACQSAARFCELPSSFSINSCFAYISHHILSFDVKISASFSRSDGQESDSDEHIENQGHSRQLAKSLGLEFKRKWFILRTKNKEQPYKLRMGPLVSRPRTYAARQERVKHEMTRMYPAFYVIRSIFTLITFDHSFNLVVFKVWSLGIHFQWVCKIKTFCITTLRNYLPFSPC